ncbi:MAG: SDR family NAD(P)-dependent oxidoreductase [Myxococcota bacterium]
MAETIVVCGYGAGISEAVARRYGREGYRVALVARTADKVRTGAAALEEAGVRAAPFPCDLADPEAVRATFAEIAATLGPVTVVHWNAYSGGAADLLAASPDELRTHFELSAVGLVTAVQVALPAMKGQAHAAVLLTGGGLALYDADVDAMAVGWHAMGLALGKAVQHKLTGLLHARLKPEGVFVGEVMVMGAVRGTAFDQGNATIAAEQVADRLWQLHQARDQVTVPLS